MKSAPVRASPPFAGAVNVTAFVPVLLAPEVTVSQSELETADQEQELRLAVTEMVSDPPPGGMETLVRERT